MSISSTDQSEIGVDFSSDDLSGALGIEENAPSSDIANTGILMQVPTCIFQADRNGQYVFVNSSWTSVTGLSLQEAYGEGWVKGLHPDDRDRIFSRWELAVQSKSSFCSDYRLIHPNGQVIWVAGKSSPYTKSGAIQGYVGALTDITRQKQIEAELNVSHECWSLILKGDNEGIWDWNLITNEVFFSERWKEMLGYAADELDNHFNEWNTRVHPDDISQLMQAIQDHLNHNDRFFVMKYRIRCKAGHYKWILAQGQAIWDETNTPTRMVGSNTDITERKHLEIEQSLSQEKTVTENSIKREITLTQLPLVYKYFSGNLEYFSTVACEVIERRQAESNLKTQVRLSAFRAEITTILAREDNLIDMLRQCSETVIAHLDAAVVQIWRLNSEIGVLELQMHSGLSLSQDSHRYIPLGSYNVGLIAQERKPYLTNVLQEDRLTHDLDWVQHQGMVSFVGYPLVVESRTIGVVSIFAQQALDSLTFQALEIAANEMAVGIERHAVKEDLKQQEELYRQIVEHVSDGIVIITPNTKRIITANPAVCHLLGVPPGKLVGQPISRFLSCDRGTNTMPFLTHASSGPQVSQQAIAIRPDGSSLDIEIVCSRLPIGKYHDFLIVIKDISDRKKFEATMKEMHLELETRVQQRTKDLIQAQAVLQESEKKFRQLSENINQVFWMTDIATNSILYVSPAFEKIWGQSRDCLYNRPWISLESIHPDDWDDVRVQTSAALQAYDIQYRIIRPDGEIRWIHDRSFPISNEVGEIYRFAGLAEDITERKVANETLFKVNEELEKRVEERTVELQKAKELAEASNKAKSVFLANMNHELRTPLNTILGFSELLAESPNLDQNQQESIRIINRSGAHLRTLINDVLDMSKIEVGRLHLTPKDIDLILMLNDVREMFGLKAQEKGLDLKIELESTVPQYIRTDEIKLRQVLINLLGNALKFTAQGHVILHVSNETIPFDFKTTLPQVNLTFAIEDTGIGIPPEELDLIFKAFVQTREGQNFQGGTGLGLAISHSFVQLLGGELTVTSQLGQGSHFQFSIPVEMFAHLDEIDHASTGYTSNGRVNKFSVFKSQLNPSVQSSDSIHLTQEICSATPDKTDILINELQVLTKNVITNLYQAALECDLDAIEVWVEQIKAENPSLARNVSALAHQFQFDSLLNAIQSFYPIATLPAYTHE